ncbi:galactokinase [Nesterenkonia marinintestina]|uniref:galactokinase n=1 Tax=Nesterenkonia marinintestina TaxID=2979865 RepID=UPI0021C1E124|nr:galactokinase family protein [Nesterenkonia sp. GX14115]
MQCHDVDRLSPGDPQQIAADFRARFGEVFGRSADGVWFAPGRANINGEHIDFHSGRCLPMALAHGTYAAAAPRSDGLLRVRTLDAALDDGVHTIRLDEVAPVDSPEPAGRAAGAHSMDAAPSWTRYVAGTIWALAQLGEESPGFALDPGFGVDLLIVSTLPIGGGLSSSAALECATALAVIALGTPLGAQHSGSELDAALTDALRAEVAAACMRAEVEVVGAGTGGLDQTVSLRGLAGDVLSLDCRDFSVDWLPVGRLLDDYVFLAVDTRQAHWLGDGQFDDRRADSEAAAQVLGVEQLRYALPEQATAADARRVRERFDERVGAAAMVAGRPADAVRRRLRHALSEMVRSDELAEIFAETVPDPEVGPEDAATLIGQLMLSGHASMRDSAQVSFPAADAIVDAAVRHGAPGGRLIGGGFGGSVLLLSRRDDVTALEAAVDRACAGAGHRRPRFVEITPSAGARTVPLPAVAAHRPH